MQRVKRNRIGGTSIVVLVVLTTVAAGCSSSSKSGATSTTTTGAPGAEIASDSYHGSEIVVAGHGDATGTPDTMMMTIGVQSTNASAQAALDQNNQEATALENTLKAKGVATKDMQTSNLSINKNYDRHGQVTGYSVSNTVTITLHGLAKAGDVIDAGAAAVGNDITFNGISLSIDDTSALLRVAREKAVKQAIAHAQQLAQAAGMKLGTVRKIDDTGTVEPTPLFLNAPQASAKAVTTPIEAGSQQLSVDVSLTFALMN
jgi:uncharacterized protein YggE